MRTGFCFGCWDLLHEGHLYFLSKASLHCDYLIIGVNDDESVRRIKGPLRPIQQLEGRLQALQGRASPYIGALVPYAGEKMAMIKTIEPNVVLMGHDQMGWGHVQWLCNEVHAELIRIGHLPGYSTTLQLAEAARKTDA